MKIFTKTLTHHHKQIWRNERKELKLMFRKKALGKPKKENRKWLKKSAVLFFASVKIRFGFFFKVTFIQIRLILPNYLL